MNIIHNIQDGHGTYRKQSKVRSTPYVSTPYVTMYQVHYNTYPDRQILNTRRVDFRYQYMHIKAKQRKRKERKKKKKKISEHPLLSDSRGPNPRPAPMRSFLDLWLVREWERSEPYLRSWSMYLQILSPIVLPYITPVRSTCVCVCYLQFGGRSVPKCFPGFWSCLNHGTDCLGRRGPSLFHGFWDGWMDGWKGWLINCDWWLLDQEGMDDWPWLVETVWIPFNDASNKRKKK